MSRHIRNSEREGEKEASFHDYQRGGVGGAREQRQRPPRQINLRRDLRSRTSLSVYVYARAPAGLACACPAVQERRAIVHRDEGFRGRVGLNDEKRLMGISCYRYYFVFNVGVEN